MADVKRLSATDLLTDRDGAVSNKDARLYNCVLETDGEGLNVLKRTGFTLYEGTVSGTGMGIVPIKNTDNTDKMISIASDVMYYTQNQLLNPTKNVLLHLDGTNGATTSTDDYGNTVALSGTCELSTTQKKFGSASLKSDATSPNKTTISGLSNDIFSGATGWTVQFWVYFTSIPANAWGPPVFYAWTSTPSLGISLVVYPNATGTTPQTFRLSLVKNGGTFIVQDSYVSIGTVSAAAWHHVALVYDPTAGHYYSYFNGVKIHDVTSTDLIRNDISYCEIIPGDFTGVSVINYIDELQISQSCLYPSGTTFTPPTSAGTTTYSVQTTQSSGTGGNPSLVSGLTGAPSIGWTPSVYYDYAQTLDLTKIAIKNTAGAWQYTTATNTLVQVTDADYPAKTARGLAYLDGAFYVMDKQGIIYGSAINDFTSWSALNFITAQSEPDPGVCLVKYNQYLVAFGLFTTEFFFDAGNPTGSPLSPVQNAQLLMGCAAADTVVQADSSVYFVSQSKAHAQAYGAGFSVHQLSGMQAQKISTDYVERLLNADGLSGAWAITCNVLAHTMYIINLPTSGISLAFDLASGKWYVWTTTTAGVAKSVSAISCAAAFSGASTGVVTVTSASHGFSDGDPITIAGATPSGYNGTFNITYVDTNTFTYLSTTVLGTASGTITATGNTESNMDWLMPCQFGSLQLFQSKTNGKLYQMSNTLYTDYGQYINTKIRTSRVDFGNNTPKFLPWMDVVTDRASTTALVRWTNDDFQNYVHYRPTSLALARSRLNRCGTFLRRAFEVRHTDATAFRFQGLDLGIEAGGE